LRPQADNFLRLLAGRLWLDIARRKNFFAVKSLKHKNFFAVGNLESQELLCSKIFQRQELLYSFILVCEDLYQDSTHQGLVYIFPALALKVS